MGGGGGDTAQPTTITFPVITETLPSSAQTERGPQTTCQHLFFQGPRERPVGDSPFPEAGPSTGHQLWALFLSVPLPAVLPPDSQAKPNSIISVISPWAAVYFCHQVSDEIFICEMLSPIPANGVY